MATRKSITQVDLFPVATPAKKPAKKTFSPTDEQRDIARAFATGRPLCINAFAGSGKTSTLRYLSLASDKRGIFWAFNRRNADDAKRVFSGLTHCTTTHAMAYHAMRIAYTHRHKMGKSWPTWKLVNVFGIPSFSLQGELIFSEKKIASDAMDGLKRWMHSADTESELSRYCYPDMALLRKKLITLQRQQTVDYLSEDIERYSQYLSKLLAKIAYQYWVAMWNNAHDMPMEHDAYLKAWQLESPIIKADYLMLDEAQDTNPCVLDIFVKQTHCQQVVVGDRYQALYSWRGAINAMDKFEGDPYYLTQSFRFGDAIAEVANRILLALDCRQVLRGTSSIPSQVGDVNENQQYTYLSRTNADGFMRAFKVLGKGKTIHILGGVKEPLDTIRSLYGVMVGDTSLVTHSDIAAFLEFPHAWSEILEESKYNRELERYVKLVLDYQTDTPVFCDKIERSSTPPGKADVLISTVHKAKGTEYPQVVMGSDYKLWFKDGKLVGHAEELHNLYVNATRAVLQLQTNRFC